MNEMNAARCKRRSHRTAPVLRCGSNNNSLNGLTVPDQFFNSAGNSQAHWTGARRLMLGVLQFASISTLTRTTFVADLSTLDQPMLVSSGRRPAISHPIPRRARRLLHN